jgi:hypothetical protein
MRHTWVAAAALLAVGACGGKTQTGGEGGAATGGNGAQAGSGGSGFGGSSFGGSSSGGSSFGGTGAIGAYGGSGGTGVGGVGAFGGGGSGTGGGSPIDFKIAELCKLMSQLPCGPFDCENQLHQSVAEATNAGCFPELDLVLDCALTYPVTCDSAGDEPALSPQCDGVTNDLEECMLGNGQCASYGGGNGCGMTCSGPNSWGVKCVSSPAGLECTCTDGPNSGLSTAIPVLCNSPQWQEMVAGLCS